MGCILRIIAAIAVLVFILSLICIFAKWIAPGFEISWGAIWGMFGGSIGVFTVCAFIANRD